MLSTQICPAEYACYLCECTGITNRLHVDKTIYPMKSGIRRTKQSVIELGKKAERDRQKLPNKNGSRRSVDGKLYKGINGYCALNDLKYFDITRQSLPKINPPNP